MLTLKGLRRAEAEGQMEVVRGSVVARSSPRSSSFSSTAVSLIAADHLSVARSRPSGRSPAIRPAGEKSAGAFDQKAKHKRSQQRACHPGCDIDHSGSI